MDQIISAVQYRDYILIFMKSGKIFKMKFSEVNGQPFYALLDTFEVPL